MTVDGWDVSEWLPPGLWDWEALRAASAERVEAGRPPLFIIARATYGTKVDATVAEYARLCRAHGVVFGAYMFFRQVHTVAEHLAAWTRAMDLVDGLRDGEIVPALDLEDNVAHGDGPVRAAIWNDACPEIVARWRDYYGGAMVYCSSGFPTALGPPAAHAWMWDPGVRHWVADWAMPDGDPRTPFHRAPWSIHQPMRRASPEFAGGRHAIDVLALSPRGLAELLIDRDPYWPMVAGETSEDW
uniref:Putative glycoside hydrolase n=1 Tax=viral metagenome TaxID=1070528 RepID=A0A6M3ILB6_9ZZZZ